MRRILVALLLLILVAVGGWALVQAGARPTEEPGRIALQRGTVVRQALAVGDVAPEHEVQVKSLNGGTVHRLLVEPGQKVAAGEPLLEVRPVTTALTEVQAERNLQAAIEGEAAAKEFLDGEHLLAHMMRLTQGRKSIERMYRSAERGRQQAEEQLRMLREGEVAADGRVLDYVIRAPVAGHVLARHVLVGDPVVAASSYGSGTVLITLADMDRPVFRGTVDEIDVGRLREGMPASITLGALPGVTLAGTLEEVALKATRRDNAVVFTVRVRLRPPPDGVLLRAGYSAVAAIEIARVEDVLMLPERVVDFRDGGAWVQLADGTAGGTERRVEPGLSDGLTVEIKAGLEDGDEVLERTSFR